MTRQQMDEKHDRSLKNLRADCPLLAIETSWDSKTGWLIKGMHGGEIVVRAQSLAWHSAASKFRAAYGTAVSYRMVK